MLFIMPSYLADQEFMFVQVPAVQECPGKAGQPAGKQLLTPHCLPMGASDGRACHEVSTLPLISRTQCRKYICFVRLLSEACNVT